MVYAFILILNYVGSRVIKDSEHNGQFQLHSNFMTNEKQQGLVNRQGVALRATMKHENLGQEKTMLKSRQANGKVSSGNECGNQKHFSKTLHANIFYGHITSLCLHGGCWEL